MRNILLVGRDDWCCEMKILLEKSNFHIESISDVAVAEKRLEHNNFRFIDYRRRFLPFQDNEVRDAYFCVDEADHH